MNMSTAPAAALLYVEDDPLIREVTAMSLEDAGFEVVMAQNAPAAYAALDAQDVRGFGAVITDINLGSGPDGWEVARRARHVNRQMPVLYVTGAEGDSWQSKAVSGSRILGKPFSPVEIVTAVLSLICRA
jgi:DNA-binding response OmpR family regulator